jgi:hypothetical protein
MKFRIGEIGENAEAPQPTQDMVSHGPKLSGNEGKPPVLLNRSMNSGEPNTGRLNADRLNVGRPNAGGVLRDAETASSLGHLVG